jgi:cytochrome c-type biogenesis protein CcmH
MRARPFLAAVLVSVAGSTTAHPAAAQAAAPPSPATAEAPPNQPMIGLTTQVPAIGADSALESRVKSVSATLRCPVCQGLSLQDSPSELAQQMRGVVRDQMAQGKSDDEVRQYFIAKYGDWILLKPKAEGFSTLVYILPALFVVLGGGLVWTVAKRWSSPAPSAEMPRDATPAMPQAASVVPASAGVAGGDAP